MPTTATPPRTPFRLLHALGKQPVTDGELLRRYLTTKDDEVFAEIVRRNGSLVLRACRHVLGETTAAEDAFQATFLLLARKGRSLSANGSLAGWLHAVAVRIAGDARRANWRRRRRESAVAERTKVGSPADELMWREVRERLDAELAALPEKYRLPLVLCYLQELSYDEAARAAGCSTGAFRGRLERGKSILRERLARFGLPLAAPILVLGQPPAVSAALCHATLGTVKSAMSGGAVSTTVAVLAGSAVSVKAKLVALAVAILATFGLAWASKGGASVEPKNESPQKTCTIQPAAAVAERGVDSRGDPLPPGAVARFGTRRFQVPHYNPFGPVTARDGKAYLIYQPGNGERGLADFRWLDAATGKVLDVWPVPTGAVFDADTGRPTQAMSHHGLQPVSLSPDGRWAILTDMRVTFTGIRLNREKPDRSFNLYIYDLAAKKKLKDVRLQLDESEAQPSVAVVSADGKWLAASGSKVRLWDLSAGKQVWISTDKEQNFGVLGFTPGNKHLVLCGSNDGAIIVVDVAHGKVGRTITTELGERRRGTLLSPDGATVLMRLVEPRETVVWDVNSGKRLAPFADQDKKLEAWAFSPDGKSFVCTLASDKSRVIVRDWPSRKVRREFELDRSGVSSIFISADNRTLNVLFSWEQTLHRYDLETGKPLPVPGQTHRSQVVGVEVAPDGSIVSLGSDRMLRTWDFASGQQTRQVALDYTPAETPFALSRDGKLIAVADYYMNSIAIFDRSGKPVRRIDTAKQRIDHVIFSPSGRLLAGSGHQAKIVRVWETATGKTVAEFPVRKGVWWSPTVDFAFSPDERYFVATTEGNVQFWEVDGWRPTEGVVEHVSGIAFSPDGRMMACGSGRNTAIWEVATRKLRTKFEEESTWNWSQRFSPDGRLLARVTRAETVEVWDILHGRRMAVFQGHDSAIRSIAFTNDGRHLLTASNDCTLLAWDVAGAVATAQAELKRLVPTDKEVAAAWKDLSSAEADKAFTAMRILTDGADRAVAFILANVKAPAPLDAAKVRDCLADLGNDSFEIRLRATQELKAMGDLVETPIRRFLAANPPLEAKRRAEQILEPYMRPPTSPERLQQLRAVEVLELIGSQSARAVLRNFAKGPAEAKLTRDATASLGRMESKK